MPTAFRAVYRLFRWRGGRSGRGGLASSSPHRPQCLTPFYAFPGHLSSRLTARQWSHPGSKSPAPQAPRPRGYSGRPSRLFPSCPEAPRPIRLPRVRDLPRGAQKKILCIRCVHASTRTRRAGSWVRLSRTSSPISLGKSLLATRKYIAALRILELG